MQATAALRALNPRARTAMLMQADDRGIRPSNPLCNIMLRHRNKDTCRWRMQPAVDDSMAATPSKRQRSLVASTANPELLLTCSTTMQAPSASSSTGGCSSHPCLRCCCFSDRAAAAAAPRGCRVGVTRPSLPPSMTAGSRKPGPPPSAEVLPVKPAGDAGVPLPGDCGLRQTA